jgi:hypothetical protein
MALAIAVVTLAACSSSDDASKYVADVTLPSGTEKTADADILVEAGAHEFTLNIKTEGEWKAESDSRFMYCKTESGKGNATVTVAVQDNESSDRKTGHILITFPGHESENKTITVEQKYLGDYGDNGANIKRGNQVYAVGYSYDTTGEWASPNSVKKQVFDTNRLIELEALSLGPVQMSLRNNTVTGSTMSEISDKLSAKASVKGSYAGFTGEVGASFNMSHAESSNYEYAITYLDYTISRAQLTMSLGTLKTKYMMDDAYRAINGLDPHYSSDLPNKLGIKRLIDDYGTHVIMSADLGGRVRRKMEVDITKITSSYDINAYVEASYEGVVDANAKVENDYKQSYESNRNAVDLNADVLGGVKKNADLLCSTGGFNKENLQNWQESVDSLNMALVNFDSQSLKPLYELVDQSRSGGQARYEELMEYIESGLANEQTGYFCGTTFKFDVPTFDDKWTSTLIKDVYLDGQWVSRICQEYVPKVNIDSRVTVIYPVINNQPRYNMGFYLGDGRSHKPARVSWSGTNESLFTYEDLRYENVKTVYMRGTSIKSVPPKNTTVVSTTDIRDSYLHGLRLDPSIDADRQSDYPLVKIFNKVWTRETYKHYVGTHVSTEYTVEMDGKPVTGRNVCYYPFVAADGSNWPSGWQVASSGEDYEPMLAKLVANGFSYPALALFNGGVTGFELCFEGWNQENGYAWIFDKQIIGTRDRIGVVFEKNGVHGLVGWQTNRFPVRLVKVQ